MTKRFEDPESGIKIDFTSAAEKILQEHGINRVLVGLTVFMKTVFADYAYVGASASSLRVRLTWLPESKTQERGSG